MIRVRRFAAMPTVFLACWGCAIAQSGLPYGPTIRISGTSTGGQANAASGGYRHLGIAMSADGRWIAFESSAGLVAQDQNGIPDIYRYDRVQGTLQLVSMSLAGSAGNGSSIEPSMSADGNVVAFASEATNLVVLDSNGRRDAFVRDMSFGSTTRVSVSSQGAQANLGSFAPVVSGDGGFVAFASVAPPVSLAPCRSTFGTATRRRRR
jgi:Tol biopolymer transport system component